MQACRGGWAAPAGCRRGERSSGRSAAAGRGRREAGAWRIWQGVRTHPAERTGSLARPAAEGCPWGQQGGGSQGVAPPGAPHVSHPHAVQAAPGSRGYARQGAVALLQVRADACRRTGRAAPLAGPCPGCAPLRADKASPPACRSAGGTSYQPRSAARAGPEPRPVAGPRAHPAEVKPMRPLDNTV